jgi:hypothetical protein
MSATGEESKFARIVSRETVLGFKVDPEFWTDVEQSLLHEGMILACKESPEWTEEEVLNACEKQVEIILFNKFRKEFGFLINLARADEYTVEDAFDDWRKNGVYSFLRNLNHYMEFAKFCEEFYEDLREMWNIDSSGVEDEFARMKEKGWTFRQYRSDLNIRIRKQKSR